MIIVDAHQDIACNALYRNREYRRSAWETRRLEGAYSTAMTGLPDAVLGRVAVVCASLFTAPYTGQDTPRWAAARYRDAGEAYRLASRQLDYYHRLADETDKLRLIQTAADLDAVLATWADDKTLGDHQQGLVVLMENADPISEPKQFEEWYERGVRIVAPASKASRYASGALTASGYGLLDIMADFKAVLDISQLAEQAGLQALDHYPGAIIASHSTPRKFHDSDHSLSDVAVRRLAERDGVLGIMLLNPFLCRDWTTSSRRSEVPLSLVTDAIDYVCQLTGSAAFVGLGSSFDDGFGSEIAPQGIETVSDLLLIGAALRERGYTPEDTEAIMSGNMLRKLRGALPAG